MAYRLARRALPLLRLTTPIDTAAPAKQQKARDDAILPFEAYYSPDGQVQRRKVPARFWLDKDNRIKYMMWLAAVKGVKSPEDWYKCSTEWFHENKGRGVLKYTGDSPVKAITETFPDHTWHEWKFKQVPRGFWTPENQRRFLRQLKRDLGLEGMDGWYQIQSSDIIDAGGAKPFYMHGANVQNFIMSAYPGHQWQEHRFAKVGGGYWDSLGNQRAALEDIQKKLGFKKMSDWYAVTYAQFNSLRGSRILRYYNNSIFLALQSGFPEHHWVPWKFANTPKTAWRLPSTQKLFMDELAAHLKLVDMDGWYSVANQDAIDFEPKSLQLLRMYNDNIGRVVKAVYPEHRWDSWRFSKISKDAWKE